MNFNRIFLSDTFVRYCLPDSLLLEIYSPETVSRVTLAALGIGFQPNLCEWKNNDFFLFVSVCMWQIYIKIYKHLFFYEFL